MKSPSTKWIPVSQKTWQIDQAFEADFMKILVQNAFVENPAQLMIAVENLSKSALGRFFHCQ